MAVGDSYRTKALELLVRAETETDPVMRADLEHLAVAYVRLAEQAERNNRFVIEGELPPEEEGDPKSKPQA